LTVELEESPKRGLFQVLVDGAVVVERKGGLLARLLGRPWPEDRAVVDAVRGVTGS